MFRKCGICELELESKKAFDDHLTLHDDSDRVICAGCNSEFLTLKQLRNHKTRCFPCKNCGLRFKKEIRRDEHLCLFTNGKPFVCACNQTFAKYNDLLIHTGVKPFLCCQCNQTYLTFPCFINHIRKHKDNAVLKCFTCGRSFPSYRSLENHTKCHGLNEVKTKVQCPECGKSMSEDKLVVHQAKHKGLSGLCPECGKIFPSNARLSQHLITTHYSEPVTCDHCQKVLKTKKILAEHLKTHLKSETGNRVAQAICPVCGLELAQKGSLGRHILLVHERHRLKPDDKPRTCKQCGELCPSSSAYYTHLRQHRAALERLPCQICSRVFNKKQNLVRHMLLLHNKNRTEASTKFACELCNKQVKEKRSMVRHYRIVHKINAEYMELTKL